MSLKSLGSGPAGTAKLTTSKTLAPAKKTNNGQRELRYVRNAAGETTLVYETSKYSSIAIAGTLDALLTEISSANSKLTGTTCLSIREQTLTIDHSADPTTFVDHLIEYHSMEVTHGQFLQAIVRSFWNCSNEQDVRGLVRIKSILTRWIGQRPRDFCTSESMQEIIFVFTSELRADKHFAISREIETSLTAILNADARQDALSGKTVSVSLDRAIAKASLTVAEQNTPFEWSNLDLGAFVKSLASLSLYLTRAVLATETVNYWMRARLSSYKGSATSLVALNNMRKRNAMLTNWVSFIGDANAHQSS